MLLLRRDRPSDTGPLATLMWDEFAMITRKIEVSIDLPPDRHTRFGAAWFSLAFGLAKTSGGLAVL